MVDGRRKAHLLGRLDVLRDDRAVGRKRRGHAERRRNRHVIDGLEHAEEHQADAHAGREQHREPAGVAVVGARLLAAEPDAAPGADDQEQAEQHEDVGGAHEEPVEGAGQRRPQPAEERGRLLGRQQRVKHESDDRQAGYQEDRIVDVEAEGAELPLQIVLTDLEIGVDDVGRTFRLGNAGGACLVTHLLSLLLRQGWRTAKPLAGHACFIAGLAARSDCICERPHQEVSGAASAGVPATLHAGQSRTRTGWSPNLSAMVRGRGERQPVCGLRCDRPDGPGERKGAGGSGRTGPHPRPKRQNRACSASPVDGVQCGIFAAKSQTCMYFNYLTIEFGFVRRLRKAAGT